ncbi:MAG: 50S ribosomal protein L11 methyltransferase [Desulfobacterales bacterium]|nr:50S ribosomal protein L11 methyltransferase [Desulfobacterales bacterium]
MTAYKSGFNRKAVLDILRDADVNLTAGAYILKIRETLSVSRSEAKKVLRSLVDDQTLAYQDLYGSTYVMQSFSKPVRITDRFSIVPPGTDREIPNRHIDIKIHQGISFGSGHHPTTRLCLAALDHLFFQTGDEGRFLNRSAGDIGTGSGILALAMCLAGMADCRAWEIDANAVSEARKNVALNRLGDRIQVIDDLMSPEGRKFSLICANLRYPTLARLAPLLRQAALPDACLVFSGLRTWEKQELISTYQDHGFTLTWERDEKNWAALIFESLNP